MWFGDEEAAARLEASGHRQIEAGDPAGARETAGQLLSMGWSGGFVIEALAHRSEGELERAVAGLALGVERAPACLEGRRLHLTSGCAATPTTSTPSQILGLGHGLGHGHRRPPHRRNSI